MKAIKAPLQDLEAFRELDKAFGAPGACVTVTGCVDAQKLHLIDALGTSARNRVIITHSDLRAKEICADYRFYDRNTTYYPAKDLIFFQADIHGNEIVRERMRSLRYLLEGRPVTFVTTFAALMSPRIPIDVLRSHVLSIDKQHPVDEKTLALSLVEMGYEKSFQVEAPGQFAIRGGIIDVFDLTEDNPYRIELWGDDVESIRSFDILSQRSIEQLESVEIFPATELILSEEDLTAGLAAIGRETEERVAQLRDEMRTGEAHRLKTAIEELTEQMTAFHRAPASESLLRYFYREPVSLLKLFDEKTTRVFLDEPAHILSHARAVEAEFRESMIHRAEQGYILPGQMDLLFSPETVEAQMRGMPRLLLETLETPAGENLFADATCPVFRIEAREIAPYNNSFDALVRDLKRYRKEGYRVLMLSGSRTRAKRLIEDLRDHDVTAFYSENPSRLLQSGEIMTYYGHLRQGFEYPSVKFAVISESDIFTEHRRKKKRRGKHTYAGEKIGDFADLKVGDYVVHEDHGLGIYRGVEKLIVDHTTRDYIKIEYAEGGHLYVLATGLSVIQKYAAAKDDDKKERKIRLNRLGSPEWSRTRAKVKSAVDEIAQDLVDLYAKRSAAQGYAYGADTVWQEEFEEAFPYEETEDQIHAIEEMKSDMESHRIMDRLICGDVGFGKTEIAIRGAFKAVQENKQVAVLVPTTILAQQHYNTFVERMQNFPVRVELLSRFRTASEQKKTIADLKKGMVDVVIGTHRLLSKDVTYKDLGLLVVDEEQRFGVAHKEKIKQLKETVDVLTLTATPIPRTLHMSLTGIRDMSLLTEAPGDRLPIQTFVCEQNDEMVREAIVRELARGGQTYYVYNRVASIDVVTDRIAALVPEARVAYAHGQMHEADLEKIMYDFIGGDIDVLVSTTIIETGLDIPNVNTMIVHDADRMGLSQLYQLRGRVGRSNRTAYAFLMYKRDKVLREVAEKRLSAIREFTDLGSGYKIAMRDLEIRGAGNLLGQKQSGHMSAVGYDLYCKMLEESVRRLKGDSPAEEERTHTSVDLSVDAFIPPDYILNEKQKLEIYKRIAGIESDQEADDMRDELLDRFGKLPESVDNLIRIARLRERAGALYLTEIKGGAGQITFMVSPVAKLEVTGIPMLLRDYGGKLSFHGAGKPCFVLQYGMPARKEQAPAVLLLAAEKTITDMEQALLLPARERSTS